MSRTSQAIEFTNNPRKITKKQKVELEVSMATYGDLSGIVYNRRSGKIVGGNQRSKIINIQECEIVITHEQQTPDHQGTLAWGYAIWQGSRFNYREVTWKEDYEKAANVLANKLGGTWDMDLLEQHWTKSELLELGWTKSELKWFNQPESFNGDAPIVAPLPTIHTKPGDLYQLNSHRLLCGSATEPDDRDKLLDGHQIGITVTDPPYNVNYQGRAGTIQNDNMPDSEFRQFLYDFYHVTSKAMRPGAVWYVFHADSKGHIFRNEFIRTGNYLAQCLIWEKDSHVMGRSDYHWLHEPILYGCKRDQEQAEQIAQVIAEKLGSEPAYYLNAHEPIIYGWVMGSHTWNSNRSQNTVLKFQKPKQSDIHPTMKPVPMLEYLISNSSIASDLVYDPFSGSGSTLIASEKQGRTFAGLDIEPKFIDEIVRRWVAYKEDKGEQWSVRKNGKDISTAKWIQSSKPK